MAKTFYTINEAAQALGVTADAVKKMADEGKIQQFRDRDNVMFKREQVDALVAASGGDEEISLVESEEAAPNKSNRKDDPRQAMGVSVFDEDELSEADPLAQTQFSSGNVAAAAEEISLESIGSGSGLLDLTRESDDTSLGSVLDEITPVSAPAAAGAGAAAAGQAGVRSFGSAGMGRVYEEEFDSAGSGMGAGFMLGAVVALLIVAFISVPAMMGQFSGLASLLAANDTRIMITGGVLALVTIVLGVGGMMLGKSSEGRG